MRPRAYYHQLRMLYESHPDLDVEPWQVMDYRRLTTEQLFDELRHAGVTIDKMGFQRIAEELDSPEEMAVAFATEMGVDEEVEDRLYLSMFELWRRLVLEKQTITIFVDDLDYEIGRYDLNDLIDMTSLETAIGNFLEVLRDHQDEGADPIAFFAMIDSYSAYDIESFLYDYIADQVDSENTVYAAELIEGFYPFFREQKWFDLLRSRILMVNDPEEGTEMVEKMVDRGKQDLDSLFHIELLSVLVQDGEESLFVREMKRTLQLIETEGELYEVMQHAIDFFHCLDLLSCEEEVQKLMEERSPSEEDSVLEEEDPDRVALQKIFRRKNFLNKEPSASVD